MANRSNLSRRQLEILSQALLFEEEPELVSVLTQTKKPSICVPDTITKQKSTKKGNVMEYRPRTLNQHNIARRMILPVFPPSPIRPEHDLLLCNVPMKLLNIEQRQHRQSVILINSSDSSLWDWIERNKINSLMVNHYQSLYVELSQRWLVEIPIIHYNLTRMIKCADENGFQLTDDELSIALEFYLQMDVDMFNLKTCSFRGAQCTNTDVFCNSTKEQVQGRYSMKRCPKFDCLCCHSPFRRHEPAIQRSAVQFIPNQIHCFVNGYEAVLNSPVTCATSNIIYALTCPCGDFDYVAHTNWSFANCLAYHRQESHRIIREFLIGERNFNNCLIEPKSNEMRANDQNWLYQHLARCPEAIQIFLDFNAAYWCLVPVPKDTTTLNISTNLISVRSLVPLVQKRNNRLAEHLANSVPTPPYGYTFTHQQWKEQQSFFKYGIDLDSDTSYNVDLYNATIVAVLPDDCTETTRKFIESLFITHTECKLNMTGRLVDQQFFQFYSVRALWCEDLIRRPSSIDL